MRSNLGCAAPNPHHVPLQAVLNAAFQQLRLPERAGFSFSLRFDPALHRGADKRWVGGPAAGEP